MEATQVKIVKQRNGSDCAIAAVANCAGQSYRTVRTTLGDVTIRGGLSYQDTSWLLSQFGDVRPFRVCGYPHISEWAGKKTRIGKRFVVMVKAGFCDDDYHYVAVVDGEIIGHCQADWPVTDVFEFSGEIK